MGQKYPNKIFLVPNLGIFAFPQYFAIRQIRGCWFQIRQYCFLDYIQKYPNQAFLVPHFGIFVFSWNFANRQIWECWLVDYCWLMQIDKYDNSLFLILAQKYPNNAFLVKNTQMHFCFFTKFCSYTYSRVLISNMTIVFKNSIPKIPKKGIFGPSFRHFHCFTIFCN